MVKQKPSAWGVLKVLRKVERLAHKQRRTIEAHRHATSPTPPARRDTVTLRRPSGWASVSPTPSNQGHNSALETLHIGALDTNDDNVISEAEVEAAKLQAVSHGAQREGATEHLILQDSHFTDTGPLRKRDSTF